MSVVCIVQLLCVNVELRAANSKFEGPTFQSNSLTHGVLVKHGVLVSTLSKVNREITLRRSLQCTDCVQ